MARSKTTVGKPNALFSISITGTEEMKALLRRSPRIVDEVMRKSMHWAVLAVKHEARKNLDGKVLNTNKTEPNNLKNSLVTDVRGTGINIVGAVGSPKPYAKVHEQGWIIRPKKAGGWLVFQIDGKWIKTKQVKIPKRPWLGPAFKSKRQAILRTFRDNTTIAFQKNTVP